MENQISNPNLNPTHQHTNTPTHEPFRDPDEIDLLEYIYALVKNKWWIIGVTFFGLFLGYVVALIKGPQWVAEVLIAPKETESQKTPSFAGLGALGGLVASQLNMGANASLDKIDLILDSREFNAQFVDSFNLVPHIYKYKWPKVYKKYWDPAQQNWNHKFNTPKPLETGDMVKAYFLKKTINKNNTMTLKIQSKDSAFTIDFANKYVPFLDEYIKSDVQNDAKENVLYLEKQLNGIADPLLREKIQALIANEIEKQMVVSKEAFKIVDPVFLLKKYKEKKLYPLVFGFGLFFLMCLIIVFMEAFSSADKTNEDKQLMEKIKEELLFFRNSHK